MPKTHKSMRLFVCETPVPHFDWPAEGTIRKDLEIDPEISTMVTRMHTRGHTRTRRSRWRRRWRCRAASLDASRTSRRAHLRAAAAPPFAARSRAASSSDAAIARGPFASARSAPTRSRRSRNSRRTSRRRRPSRPSASQRFRDAAATIDIDPTVAASSFADALEAVNGAPPAEEVATGAQRMEGILSPISDTLEAFVLGTQDLFKEKGVPYPLGSAIIFTTFCVKALTYPFTKTQLEATLNIQNLAPQTEAIRERYKNDTERMNIEINRLYEENQVSPLAGCVPILLTLPVVWGLYRAFNNASIDGSFDEPWFFIPSLAGPSPERNLDWLFPLDASNNYSPRSGGTTLACTSSCPRSRC